MAENARKRAALRKKNAIQLPPYTEHPPKEGEDKSGDSFNIGPQTQAREEGLVTFVNGYTYSQIETFALRFGIPFDALAERVGQFLLNSQRR